MSEPTPSAQLPGPPRRPPSAAWQWLWARPPRRLANCRHGQRQAKASRAGCAECRHRHHATSGRIQKALLCLHNAERRSRGLSKLRLQPQPRPASPPSTPATWPQRHYFAHYSRRPPRPHGPHRHRAATSPARAAGPPARTSTTPPAPRLPASCCSAWMHSPAHRQNILRRRLARLRPRRRDHVAPRRQPTASPSSRCSASADPAAKHAHAPAKPAEFPAARSAGKRGTHCFRGESRRLPGSAALLARARQLTP